MNDKTTRRLAEVSTAPDVRTETITVDGIRTPLLTAGPPDADEAVVFIHGNPGPSDDWRRLVAATGAFTRAVASDMPGYGGADKPRDFPYTVDGYAGHLGRVLDHLGILRAHLVLHDFGGMWGLAWAAAHPDRVASVMLINTGVLRDYRWHYLARIWRTPIAGELFMRMAVLVAVRMLLRHGNPRGLPDEVLRRIHRDFNDPGVRRAILRLYRATPPGALGARELHDRLRRLDLPALVVWGARDPYINVRYAQQQRETFARADVVILDHSGHWPMVDDPVAVERVATRFLLRQVVPNA